MTPNVINKLSDHAALRASHHHLWALMAPVVIATVGLWPPPASAQAATAAEQQDDRVPISGRRIVKHFDFNEKPLNNFETVPMFWRRHGGYGFPIFLEGKFDEQVGHDSKPSFRLNLDGGSLAYHYEGRDIAVRTNSDYLVVAWVQTDSLDTARAYISANFLDRKGDPIPGTERRSRLVGGPDKPTEWQAITIGLQGNIPGARYIGLSLWLTQGRIWNTAPRPLRHIAREDVKASVWFDDITVYRLPLVSLQTANPGNIFGPDDPVELRPLVNDPDGLNLQATLVIRSTDGLFADERNVPIQTNSADRLKGITYDHLPVGLYHAKLTVRAGTTPLVWRSLRFARLSPRFSPPVVTGKRFGVVLDSIDLALLPGQRELLKELWAEYVKLPVWYAQLAVTGQMAQQDEAIDRYLEATVDAHGDPIGIIMDDPADTDPGTPSSIRSMLDLFSEDPLTWKPLIATTWSRYSGLIHVWQIGNDNDESIFLDDRLGHLIPVLRREMKSLMGEPALATSCSTTYKADPTRHADYQAVRLPATVRTDDISRHLQPLIGQQPQRYWVTVESLPGDTYPRSIRLADLARRLAETAFQNVGGVFLSAPWEAETVGLRTQANPNEDYLILRTLADILGGAIPVSRTTLDGQAHGLVFDRNTEAVMFVWDDYAPPAGREHMLYLGERAEQFDIWGRPIPIESVGNLRRVRIGPTPTFIVNTPTWLVEWQRRFVVEPSLLEASLEKNDRQLVFTNTFREPVSGIVRLIVPEGWEVRPTKFPFSLLPKETFRQTISLRFPLNAEAGIKPLIGEFTLDADRRYQLLAPAWFELGLNNIDIDTFVWRKSDRVVVRQSMTNRTDRTINFESYLIPPNRQRLTRLFVNFQPGQSLTKDYVLDHGVDLAGQQVRLGLREIEGSRLWNHLITIP